MKKTILTLLSIVLSYVGLCQEQSYINLEQNISFKIPSDWTFDENNPNPIIFEAHNKPERTSFIIAVEPKICKNLWEALDTNRLEIENIFTTIMLPPGETTTEPLIIEKVEFGYRGKALRGQLEHLTDNEGFYENTRIMWIVGRDNKIYYFGLSIPTEEYNNNKDFFDNFYQRISFFINIEENENGDLPDLRNLLCTGCE